MSTKESLYKYRERIARYRRIIKNLRNGDLALKFLDHLGVLGLSDARISKYASHIPPLLRVIDFDLTAATKQDVETVVAWINSGAFHFPGNSTLCPIFGGKISFVRLIFMSVLFSGDINTVQHMNG